MGKKVITTTQIRNDNTQTDSRVAATDTGIAVGAGAELSQVYNTQNYFPDTVANAFEKLISLGQTAIESNAKANTAALATVDKSTSGAVTTVSKNVTDTNKGPALTSFTQVAPWLVAGLVVVYLMRSK